MISASSHLASHEKAAALGLLASVNLVRSALHALTAEKNAFLTARNNVSRAATPQLDVVTLDSFAQMDVGGRALSSENGAVTTSKPVSILPSANSTRVNIAAGITLAGAIKRDGMRGAAALDEISRPSVSGNGLAEIVRGPRRNPSGVGPALQSISAFPRSRDLPLGERLLESKRKVGRFDSHLSGLAKFLDNADALPRSVPPPFQFFPEEETADFIRLRWHLLDDDGLTAAALRLTAFVPWDTGRKPGVKKALTMRARKEQRPVRDVMRDELIAGFYLAMDSSAVPQPVRFRNNWLTDGAGKKEAVAPESLPRELFLKWFYAETISKAEASLLEMPNEEMPIGFFEGGHELIGPEPDPLQIVIARVPGPLLMRMLDVASPRQLQILALLGEGMSKLEVAQELGIARATLDVQLHRLREKLG